MLKIVTRCCCCRHGSIYKKAIEVWREQPSAGAKILVGISCFLVFAAAAGGNWWKLSYRNDPTIPSDAFVKPLKPSATGSIEAEQPAAGIAQNRIRCDQLATSINDLNFYLRHQKQAERKALFQAEESRRNHLSEDCWFWTQRTHSLVRQIQESREELRKLTAQKTQNGCPN